VTKTLFGFFKLKIGNQFISNLKSKLKRCWESIEGDGLLDNYDVTDTEQINGKLILIKLILKLMEISLTKNCAYANLDYGNKFDRIINNTSIKNLLKTSK